MDLKILFSQFDAKRLDSKIKYSRKMRNLQYTHKMFSVFIIPYLLHHLFKLLLSVTERQICREKLGEMLGERVITVADLMNRHDYVPKMPNQTELDLIFDTSLPDVQPYLFRVCWQSVFRTVVFNWPYARDENQVF